MTAYIGGNKIKDTGEYGVYLGSPNTNCLTYTPKNVNLTLSNGTLTLKAGSKVYVPNGYDTVKYYKYTYEAWTQPVLSANGTLGGNSFAVAQSNVNDSDYAYKAFDNNSSTQFTNKGKTGSLTFYNPVPIKVTNLHIMNGFNGSYVRPISSGVVSGSNDNNGWTVLKEFTNTLTGVKAEWDINLSDNKKAYKYYKVDIVGSSDFARITELTITATQQTGSVESTSADYDYTVGSGQMKFDEVVIENDLTSTQTQNGVYFVYIDSDNQIFTRLTSLAASGTTKPTNNSAWYDTNNNVIERLNSGGVSSGLYLSLPLAIITVSNGVISSIDQTFDWCGYIGSTAFVLPGVKGLIPNGFNADGTYKSIEFETDKVLARDIGTAVVTDRDLLLNSGYIGFTECTRNEEDNLLYNPDGDVVTAVETGKITTDGTKITSLTPYTAQPLTTVIPVKEIYNGSELVYQYQTFTPGTVFIEAANTGTKVYTLDKGVYKVALCGARGRDVTTVAGGYAWGNAGSGGGFVEVLFYVSEKTTVTLYSTSQGNGASYMNFGSTRMITANGGADGAGAAGTCSVSSSLDVIQTIKNVTGNKGGTALASTPNVATVSTYGNWGSTANSSGGVRLEYIRLKR